jgi:L-alanine-DL-glutamate epimerase-like enolase superfamily enzyme
VVRVYGGGERGLGYSYAHASAAELIRDKLAAVVEGHDALAVPGAWETMRHEVRNVGRPGLASIAIAAVDTALWT